MKLVKHADGMVQSAEVLFRNHQSIMRGDDRILAEDWILSAKKLRRGVERKLWLARVRQARLYFELARSALDKIKEAVEMAVEIRNREGKGAFFR